MHRFFVEPGSAPRAGRLDLPHDIARQISTVLRLRPAETIAVFDGSGSEWTVRLERVAVGDTWGQVVEQRRPDVEPAVALTLCVAVLKAVRFEFVLQRCTEAGVARFQPFLSERCVAEMPRGTKLARWERIVREAAEQSGRVIVPPILSVIDLADLPGRVDLKPVVALWEEERAVGFRQALECAAPQPATRPPALSLLIGPEGGLESSEVETLVAAGVQIASIGPRVLRAETAALAASVAALYHFGQMDHQAPATTGTVAN